MYAWRITKYNPLFRDQQGIYFKDEWTSMYDIGSTFPDGLFNIDEYLRIENLYVNAVTSIMDCIGVNYLQIEGLEKWSDSIEILDFNEIYDNEMSDLFKQLCNGDKLDKQMVRIVCKLILRNNLWCRLTNERMYVHFGHEYYMFVGCLDRCEYIIKEIVNSGLYVEHYLSPINVYEDDE
ncbi:MAG: hypothetical protein K0S51_2656 [Bacillales bacterium]|jgi:hypothetical protein|nr:hypothetical protein [Bacillales bacterium]